MGKKLAYEEVKNFIEVESGSGCRLLSKEYTNNNTKMMFRCKCGNEFKTSFSKFKDRNQRQCKKCSKKNRMIDIKYIKEFIKNKSNNTCKLISNEYKGYKEDLIILCKCGCEFVTTWESISSPKNKIQCKTCKYKGIANKNKHTYEYIKHFIEVESNSGCKLLSTKYINADSRILIQCNCGNTFSTTWTTFRRDNKRKCDKCVGIKWDYNQIKFFIEEKSKSNCKLISTNFKNINNKIQIQCKCGETFQTTFSSFKYQNKRQCDKCSQKQKTLKHEDVKKYIETNSECKLLSKTYVGIHVNMSFVCQCGRKFKTSFHSFKYANKRRCNICSNSISKSELKVLRYLENNNIKTLTEYSFDDCRNIHPLPFDFAVFNNNKPIYLIELDGQHHYYPVKFGGCSNQEALKRHLQTKRHDSIKNQYCKDNNIPLLRIPYWEFDNIETILEEWLQKYDLIHKEQEVI